MQWVRGPLGHRSVTVLLSRYFAAAESYNLGHFFSALLRSISSAVKEMLIPAGRAKDMRRVRQGSFRRWPPRTNEVSQNIVPPAQVQVGGGPNSWLICDVSCPVLSVALPRRCGCDALWRQNAVNL